VYALAKDHPLNSIEDFGLHLAKHFMGQNSQIHKVRIELSQKQWAQILDEGKLHPKAYQRAGNEKWNAVIEMTTNKTTVQSGISDLLILKTTDSGFSNFKHDNFTTLKDTEDRIFVPITKVYRYNILCMIWVSRFWLQSKKFRRLIWICRTSTICWSTFPLLT